MAFSMQFVGLMINYFLLIKTFCQITKNNTDKGANLCKDYRIASSFLVDKKTITDSMQQI